MIVWQKSSYSVSGWYKSMHSGANDACVEVGWFKSSYSGHQTDACVEVKSERGVLVRDGKNPSGGHLVFTSEEWNDLLQRVKSS
jgi:Domain of unknown function (DUF397)